jgi:predicted RNA-binding Zn ribbon-like protein
MALDLVNTELVNRGRPVDLLQTFEDLLSWLQQAGAIGERPAEEALNRWGGTRDADETLRHALALRAVLREMAIQITQGASVPTDALDLVNSTLRRRHGYTQVVQSEDGYRRVFHLEAQQPEDLLVPVAEAAGDLICNADLSLIRKCENPKCVLYYWDTSKNHARRWCSMTVCGNRAKAAAHYRRVRAKADSTGSSPQDMDT